MDIYTDHLENLNHAANSVPEKVLHEVGGLGNCMRSYHKAFKSTPGLG